MTHGYLFVSLIFFLCFNHALLSQHEPVTVAAESGVTAEGGPPLAEGQGRFLGSAWGTASKGFTGYWNQVTPENAGKWGSVEQTKDEMDWTQLDKAYQLAQDNGLVFRFHVLIWGNQQPAWIEGLPANEQLEEIKEWFAAVAARYPDIDYLEVVNEPLHDPPNQPGNGGGNYIKALGGAGATGWDWVVESFRLARSYFPDAKLMINEYNVVNSAENTDEYLEIIALLKAENLIDGVGVQAHAFSTRGVPSSTIAGNLDRLAATGLFLQVTELDIDGPTDKIQLAEYQRVFPIFWGHPEMAGITLWGFRPGMWRTDEKAYLVTEEEEERPAMLWLRDYIAGEVKDVSSVTLSTTTDSVEVGGMLQMDATVQPADATVTAVTWSVEAGEGSTADAAIDENGLLTARQAGRVTVTATAIDGSGVSDSMGITIYDDTVTGLDADPAQFGLYPNPVTTGSFRLIGIENIDQVKIFDLSGRPVKEVNVEDRPVARIALDVVPGLYLIRLYNGQKFIFRKIIIQ